jgi:hypothetical protein
MSPGCRGTLLLAEKHNAVTDEITTKVMCTEVNEGCWPLAVISKRNSICRAVNCGKPICKGHLLVKQDDAGFWLHYECFRAGVAEIVGTHCFNCGEPFGPSEEKKMVVICADVLHMHVFPCTAAPIATITANVPSTPEIKSESQRTRKRKVIVDDADNDDVVQII